MAWSDIKTTLDTIKLRTQDLKAEAQLTAKDALLEREDAKEVVDVCNEVIEEVLEIRNRAEDEQEPKQDDKDSKAVQDIRNAKDCVKEVKKNAFGYIEDVVLSSESVGKKVTLHSIFEGERPPLRRRGQTTLIEDLR